MDKRANEPQTDEQATARDAAAEAAELTPEAAQAQLAELRAQLEEKTREAQESLDRLRRAQADFQNYKKRKEREQEELFTLLEDRVLVEILPLYDDLQRAFESLAHNDDRESFLVGVERIFAKFKDLLDKKRVQPVDALGKKFDPTKHEVLLAVEAEGPPHVVLEEFERGYLRGERLLRPSRVKVSRPRLQPAPAEAETRAPQEGSAPQNNATEKES